MYSLVVARGVLKELGNVKRYPAKQFRQIVLKILGLTFDPRPADVKKVSDGFRVDVGEYRIYYEIDDGAKTVTVLLVDKRGDDRIYRRLKRKYGS